MKTPRLLLRKFLPEDWPSLHAYLSLEEVVRFEPYGVFSEEDSRKEALRRSKDPAFWAVCLLEPQQLIGNIYLAKQDFGTWELGYVFHTAYQGHGYATEAAEALISRVFEEENAHKVIAQCNPKNMASWKLLERLGLRREGHLKENIYFEKDPEGKPLWIDTYEYGILASEWAAKKQRDAK